MRPQLNSGTLSGPKEEAMSASAERKRMWVADVVLRRAAELVAVELASEPLPTDLDKIDVPTARAANRANLDVLESLGRA
jgi:hypothetical protein